MKDAVRQWDTIEPHVEYGILKPHGPLAEVRFAPPWRLRDRGAVGWELAGARCKLAFGGGTFPRWAI